MKSCGYQYFEYVTTWVDDGMAISDNPDRIIKALEKSYVVQGVKGLFDEEPRYGGYCGNF